MDSREKQAQGARDMQADKAGKKAVKVERLAKANETRRGKVIPPIFFVIMSLCISL